MSVLVIGASGFVGGASFRYFREVDDEVFGTCRSPVPGMLRFDLLETPLALLDLDWSRISHAVIAAAFTDMERCGSDAAREINVRAPKRVIDELWERDVVPVFLSSDYVYSGDRGCYTEEDAAEPILAYGAQKVEVERYLADSGGRHIVARISHVYGTPWEAEHYLSAMVRELGAGRTIRCATDQVFNPTYLEDTAVGIAALVQSDASGVYNVAADESLSRYALACKICDHLGVDSDLVEPCLINDFDFAEIRPTDTSLCVAKYRKLAGTPLRTTEEVFGTLEWQGA